MRLFNGDNKVVSIAGYKNDVLFPEIEAVSAYWEGLRMGRLVPQRSEIDPRGIDRALANTFILERIAPGLARIRLTGCHLNDLLGMEVSGMPFTALLTPESRQQMCTALEAVFDGPQTATITLTAERRLGKPPMDAKLVLLPLRSDLGEITRIMGCFVAHGAIGRTPRRFDVVDVKMTALTSVKLSNENRPKNADIVPSASGKKTEDLKTKPTKPSAVILRLVTPNEQL